MTAFVGVNTDSLGAGTHTFNSSDAPTGSEFVLIHLLLPGTVPTRGRRGLGLVHTGRR
jgi:hypothetical protein